MKRRQILSGKFCRCFTYQVARTRTQTVSRRVVGNIGVYFQDGGNPPSHIPAHELVATVASFRTWRGLQPIIAREPERSPQALTSEVVDYVSFHNYWQDIVIKIQTIDSLFGIKLASVVEDNSILTAQRM